MSQNQDIRFAIQQLAGTSGVSAKIEGIVAMVDSVDLANRTCDVSTISADEEVSMTGIALQASIDNGIIPIPSIGSTVLIGNTPSLQPFVLMFSSIDYYYVVVNKTVLKIDANGFMLQREEEKLSTILKDLITQIQSITVPTPAGTSGVPNNITDFSDIATRIDNLLT
jgi:hypothetical protein